MSSVVLNVSGVGRLRLARHGLRGLPVVSSDFARPSNESDNKNETRGVAGQEEWKWLGHGILPTWLFLGKRSFSVMATSWWDDNSHKCEDVF